MELTDKKALRKSLILRRNEVGTQSSASSSLLVCQHILDSESYKKASHIMGYLAFGPELNIDAVLQQALQDGKRVYVPHIVSKTAFEVVELHSLDNLVLDRYGIRNAPEPYSVMEPGKLDLILVPGVAFARDGGRMGMGAGYYDRFLAGVPQVELIGVAYGALLQDKLPMEAHDVPIPRLVTEAGWLKTGI